MRIWTGPSTSVPGPREQSLGPSEQDQEAFAAQVEPAALQDGQRQDAN
jgi:hypothetical protein